MAENIAVDDVQSRQMGVSVAHLHGSARRISVRLYAASGVYREGEDTGFVWSRK